MRHCKLLSFLLVYSMLAGAVNPPCRDEECYTLLERDLGNTQQQTTTISNSLETITLDLTATLLQLDEAITTANDTFLYSQQLDLSGPTLFNTFTSVSAGVLMSQRQIFILSGELASISNNATSIVLLPSNATTSVNQIIDLVNISIQGLNQIENDVLPMLEDLALLISEQAGNGSQLYGELASQFTLLANEVSQLFNSCQTSLSILNATIDSLINSTDLQQDVSADTLTQMMMSQGIPAQLNSLADGLTSIRRRIVFWDNYIAIEETFTYPAVPIDQITQQLQDAIQLTNNVRSLLDSIPAIIAVRNNASILLLSYEAIFDTLRGQVQLIEQGAVVLYNASVMLNQSAASAVSESGRLVAEAQNLMTILQNFSSFVDEASESLQRIENVQLSAMDAINTANNISNMIMQTYQNVRDSLLILMESSNLSQVIETTLNAWRSEVMNARQTTMEDLVAIASNQMSLETAQSKAENITADLISQQEYVSGVQAEIEVAARTLQNLSSNCSIVNTSVMELQLRLDNLNSLSDGDVAEVRSRLTMVELSTDNVQNMTARLNYVLAQQRATIVLLEGQISDIEAERDSLRQVYNSLPQSCDEMV